MQKKYFGTDGVRGLANQHPMTPEMAMALGQAASVYFRHEKGTRRILIGKDTRRSSYMFEQAIAAGVTSMGGEAVFLGPMPTPGVAFLTKAMRADAGIMISASHNPYQDNGIKFFDGLGHKLTDEAELEIEAFLDDKLKSLERPIGDKIGRAYRVDDATGRYVESLKSVFPREDNLDGLKIVVDCAHGAAYKIAPSVFWELGADVISLGVKPNGKNINGDCGALHPQTLCETVLAEKANIGIALDGDADRVVLCDEHGQIVDGDHLIAMCALELQLHDPIRGAKIVGTILSNMGVENYLAARGIGMIRTAVGDRYILEALKENSLILGGEPSGHVIFLDHATTGDGVLAGLKVLAMMVRSGRPLSSLVGDIPLYPQVTKNIRVKERVALESIPAITQTIQAIEARLKGKGRVVVRYSGTEPLLRVMLEGEDASAIQKEQDVLEKVILANL